MEIRKFTFQFELEGAAYCPENCEKVFGSKNAYNEDFPAHAWVGELPYSMVQDALCHVINFQMKLWADTKAKDESELSEANKSYLKYLKGKEKEYEHIRDSIKCVKNEIVQEQPALVKNEQIK